jgi:two-component system response regulator YesN
MGAERVRPYSVVIVDDEKVMRLGLSSYFSSDEGEFEVDATFQNAVDAWGYLRDHAPDVLLCDVKMPIVNGIELIRLVKSEHPETKVVVLTGHADFEYTRQAFAGGANEYVLKHEVDRDQLLRILRRVLGAAEEEKAESSNGMQKDRRSFLHFAAGLINALRDDDSSQREFLHHYRLEAPLKRIVLAKLHQPKEYDPQSQDLVENANKGLLIRVVDSTVESWIGSGRVSGEVFHAPDGDLMIVFDASDGRSSTTDIDEHCRAIQRSVAKYFNVPPQIGVSDQTGAEELSRNAAEHASCAIEYSFAILDRPVWYMDCLTSGESSEPDLEFPPAASVEAWKQRYYAFLSAVRGRPREGARIRQILKKAFTALTAAVVRDVPSDVANEVLLPESQIDALCEKLDSARAAEQLGVAILDNLNKVRRSGKQRRKRLESVARYIEENFAVVHSLRDIAESFDMSSSHLSREFKRRHGITITEKIHSCRIEEARRLIAFTALSDKEISFTVGYHDPNYFSRSFKKRVGMTVTQYRRSTAGRLNDTPE